VGSSGGVTWNLTDHLGSVHGIVDSGGQLVDTLKYDAFGVLTTESNPSGGEGAAGGGGVYPGLLPRYAGYEWDSALGLYHVGARWYDPSQGRWLSRDPLGFDAGDVNLYRYVGNSPTELTDPSGLEPPEPFSSRWLEPPEPFSSRWWDRVRSGRAYQLPARPLPEIRPLSPPLPEIRLSPGDLISGISGIVIGQPPFETIRRILAPPTVQEVLGLPHVRRALDRAWAESNPYSPAVRRGLPGSQKREQSGWIMWNAHTQRV
jgi:RHS repeat-associated protein